MKKFSMLLAAALFFSCTFCACGDDDEEEDEPGKDPQSQVDPNNQTGKDINNNPSENTGENNQGENNQGENNQGENNQGGNNQGENNQGENNQGENNQGENNQGENNQGENNQGENTSTVTILSNQVKSISMVGVEEPDYTADYEYTYDANGKVTKVYWDGELFFSYLYDGDKQVTVTKMDDDEVVEVTYTYTSDGYISLRKLSEQLEDYEVTDYKHEGNTLSFKETYTDESVPFQQQLTLTFYNDGNLKSLECNQLMPENEVNYWYIEIEYSDKPNNLSVDIFSVVADLDEAPIHIMNANRNKYLPTKITTIDKMNAEDGTGVCSNEAIFTYQYTFDNDGYITKIVETANTKDYNDERYLDHYEYTINY